MKIYIASSFNLIPRIESVCRALEANGHEVLVKWWTRVGLKKRFMDMEPDDFYADPECKYAYETDLKGIEDCDALVFICDVTLRHSGANVEVGMAHMARKPVYALGRIQNSAMYYPVMRVTLQQLLQLLHDDPLKPISWVPAADGEVY